MAYRVLTVWSVLTHPDTRGVKCLLRDGTGRALFVRHHYGNRRQWELPGGGVHRHEAPCEAARREAWEELGADVTDWEQLALTKGLWQGKHEALAICGGDWPGGPVRPDPVEIAATGWFALEDPPQPLGPTTRAALAAAYPDR